MCMSDYPTASVSHDLAIASRSSRCRCPVSCDDGEGTTSRCGDGAYCFRSTSRRLSRCCCHCCVRPIDRPWPKYLYERESKGRRGERGEG